MSNMSSKEKKEPYVKQLSGIEIADPKGDFIKLEESQKEEVINNNDFLNKNDPSSLLFPNMVLLLFEILNSCAYSAFINYYPIIVNFQCQQLLQRLRRLITNNCKLVYKLT